MLKRDKYGFYPAVPIPGQVLTYLYGGVIARVPFGENPEQWIRDIKGLKRTGFKKKIKIEVMG